MANAKPLTLLVGLYVLSQSSFFEEPGGGNRDSEEKRCSVRPPRAPHVTGDEFAVGIPIDTEFLPPMLQTNKLAPMEAAPRPGCCAVGFTAGTRVASRRRCLLHFKYLIPLNILWPQHLIGTGITVAPPPLSLM